MPLAPVDDKGTQLSYEDSGAPAQSTTYVTLVLVHGAVFHGPIFKPMFKFAAEHNMRLVVVTCRDYPGSTPFTTAELDALHHPDREIQASMIRERGFELAAFLAWFIRTENIPPLTNSTGSGDDNGKVAGGLAILGWSWGNCMTISFLSHADSLPQETAEVLEPYMRTLFLYDPPHFVFGTPDPPRKESRAPTQDPTIPPEKKTDLFSLWVSSYYHHPPSILSSLSSLTCEELMAGLAASPLTDLPLYWQPTINRMSSAEKAETIDPTILQRSQPLMFRVDRSIYYENADRALYNSTTWPRLRAVLVWCDMSPPEMIYAVWEMTKRKAESWPSTGRDLLISKMQEANHFPHWDQPESTVRFLAELI